MKHIDKSRMWPFYKTITLVCSVTGKKRKGSLFSLGGDFRDTFAKGSVWDLIAHLLG